MCGPRSFEGFGWRRWNIKCTGLNGLMASHIQSYQTQAVDRERQLSSRAIFMDCLESDFLGRLRPWPTEKLGCSKLKLFWFVKVFLFLLKVSLLLLLLFISIYYY